MPTRDQLLARRQVYQATKNEAIVAMKSLQQIADANQGAIEAIDWLLAEIDKEGAGENPAPETEEAK